MSNLDSVRAEINAMIESVKRSQGHTWNMRQLSKVEYAIGYHDGKVNAQGIHLADLNHAIHLLSEVEK